MTEVDPPPERAKPEFQRLHGGPRLMSAERVARHQRRRLCRAMVELAGERGFAKLTIRELVALAGVSRSVFYENFADKEECFWAAFEAIVSDGAAQVEAAYRAHEGLEAKLRAGLGELTATIAAEPLAAHFVFVDSLCLGADSVEPRAQAAERLEAMIRQSLATGGPQLREPQRKIRAVVGGVAIVGYRALREGRPERLQEGGEELFEWGMSYWRAALRRPAGAPSAGERLVASLDMGLGERGPELPWEEPAASQRSREALSQRERILRGAAQAAAERGYGGLSIPAISAAAGVSNQTFYEHFDSAQEAFLAAFEAMAGEVLAVSGETMASHTEWPEALAASILAFLACCVERPLFREIAFLQLPAAGSEALDRLEQLLVGLMGLLAPEEEAWRKRRPPQIAIEAIAGGIWALVQREIDQGRGEELIERTAEIIDLVLIPFGLEE